MRWTTIHNFPSSLVNWQTDKQTKPNNQPTSVKTCTPWLLQCTLYFRNSKVSAAAKNIIKMQVVNAWRLTQTSRTFSVSGAFLAAVLFHQLTYSQTFHIIFIEYRNMSFISRWSTWHKHCSDSLSREFSGYCWRLLQPVFPSQHLTGSKSTEKINE